MSEMTDIEKQRGKEYSKEELFEALSAAKKEALSSHQENLKAGMIIIDLKSRAESAESSLDKWKERANGFEERVDFLNSRNLDAQKGVDEANAERDRYRTALDHQIHRTHPFSDGCSGCVAALSAKGE